MALSKYNALMSMRNSPYRSVGLLNSIAWVGREGLEFYQAETSQAWNVRSSAFGRRYLYRR